MGACNLDFLAQYRSKTQGKLMEQGLGPFVVVFVIYMTFGALIRFGSFLVFKAKSITATSK